MSNALVTKNLPIPATGSLDSYIQAVNRISVLSVEDEQALSRHYRDDSDLDAARELITAHLRFVVHVARGYLGYGLPLGDLIQEGNVGLMKAVKRFDPDRGVRLVSFAVHWIRAEIHEFILKNWRIVKVATTKAQRKLFFNLRKSKKRLGWLSYKEVQAVAEDLGVPPATVVEMESRLSGQDVGYDGYGSNDDDDSPYMAPVSYLQGNVDDPDTTVEAADMASYQMNLLANGLDELDARSRDIIQRRWLNENKTTLQALGDEYNISAERIRQLEAAAMKKVRAAMDKAA